MATNVSDMESYQKFALEQQQANNEWNAAQAAKQIDFQMMMSDTAHQREVADLKAAGLNPVLSSGGQGASSAQGAAAEADNSAAGNVGAILQQVLQAQSAREVAAMYNAATIAAAQIAASASMYGSDMNYQNQEDHPSSPGAVAGRLLNTLVGGSSGKKVPSIYQQAKQAVRNTALGIKARVKNPDFYSWMRSHGGIPKKLGVGSQQWHVALKMFQSGKIANLSKFLRQFR